MRDAIIAFIQAAVQSEGPPFKLVGGMKGREVTLTVGQGKIALRDNDGYFPFGPSEAGAAADKFIEVASDMDQ